MRVVVALVLGSLLTAGAVGPARAETILDYVKRVCPNRAELTKALQAADEADAVKDSTAWSTHREAARQFFRCYQRSSEPYARDAARLIYAGEMLQGIDSAGITTVSDAQDAVDLIKGAEKTINDVAATTRYPSLRKIALPLRNQLNTLLAQAEAKLKELKSAE